MIPSDWNLRKLSRGQKSWITKLSRPASIDPKTGNAIGAGRFRSLIEHPSHYSAVKVKRGQRQALARSNIPVVNGKAILKRGREGNAKITNHGKYIDIDLPNEKRRIYLSRHVDFLKTLETLKKRKLKNGQFWMASIGDKEPFGFQFEALGDLMAYMKNIKWESESARNYVNLVLITVKDWKGDLDEE